MGNDKSKPKGSSGPPPAAAQPVVSKTVSQAAQIKQTVQRLEQRRDFLEKKQQNELLQAKAKSKKGNKAGALQHLKRKKMYEKEMEKISNGIINLEQQVLAIESSSVTVDIVNAMKSGKAAMQTVTQQVDVDDLQDLQDDIAELQQTQEEIDQVISTPLDTGMDEDELESELAELEAGGLEEELNALPAVPTQAQAAPSAVDSLPAAPTHAPKISDEEAALAELEREMQAA